MKIGIDIDEVIVDYLNHFHDFFYLQTGVLFTKDQIKNKDWHISWNIEREESRKHILDFLNSKSFDEISFINGADTSIRKLSKDNDLFFITSRPLDFKEKTEKWKKRHFPKENIDLIFASDYFHNKGKPKSQICEELGIKVMLEDGVDTAVDCASNGLKVLLFNKPWNQDVNHKNIIRVTGWKEALSQLNKLSD